MRQSEQKDAHNCGERQNAERVKRKKRGVGTEKCGDKLKRKRKERGE